MTKKSLSFSLVVETENLGMAQIEDLRASLDSLALQSLSVKKANEVIIVVGTHVSPAVQTILKRDYPWITLHKAKGSISYTSAKYMGAKAASGEIVVFVDSDVRYPHTWLSSILEVFTKYSDAKVALCDTRVEITSPYTLALNLTWMIDIRPSIKQITPYYSFNLNNFGIRRDFMLAHPFPALNLYRGHISLWRKMLANDGGRFYRIPKLVCFHKPPSSLKDYVYRMIIYGADFVASADYFLKGAQVVYSPSFIRRLGNVTLWAFMKIKQFLLHTYRLATENIQNIRHLLLAIPISFIGFTLTMIGAITALFAPRYFYDLINDYESSNN